MLKRKLHIVKIGGQIINELPQLNKILVAFSQLPNPKILVHGGGHSASEMEKSLGLETKQIDGRRITDSDSLKVVVMTYAGYTNKTIVSILQSLNCNALGLSGADMNLIKSNKRVHPSIDFGFVGDIDRVNTKAFNKLFDLSVVPVVCAITHDKNAQLLNTNADSIACQTAIALSDQFEVSLKYCFEYNGVLKNVTNPDEVISYISQENIEKLKSQGVIHSGMLPKIDNALEAKLNGVAEVCICGIDNLLTEEHVTWIK